MYVIHLKCIEKEEDPCKDSGIGAHSQQPNHPRESQEGENDHKSLQECAACGRDEWQGEGASGALVAHVYTMQ